MRITRFPLLRALAAERLKFRHAPVWLAFLVLPLISAVLGAFNYLQNLGLLHSQWYSLWTQQTLFYCHFFFPTLIGVYCAYLCRLEHLGSNWNAVLCAPTPFYCVFLAKLLMVFFMLLLTQAFVGALFILSGLLCGLRAPLPAGLPLWLLGGLCSSAAVGALQLALSLAVRSFAVPVGIALAGGIAGLAALAKGYGLAVPYALIPMGMQANGVPPSPGGRPGRFYLHCALYLAAFCAFGILWLRARDAPSS